MNELHYDHRIMLTDRSGIHPDLITTRGYRTVTTKADLERLGFSPRQRNVPALLIPLYSPTGELVLYQLRPDSPRINDRGKPVKYEMPSRAQMVLDMHPSVKGKAGDPDIPLFVTEGVKKGDALASQGLCTVALIGVWNFRGTNEYGGKTALPEWEFIALNGRDVYIVFDSDVMTKKEVHAALVRLKAMLEHRKARIKLVYLPDAADGTKQGVDDYLAAGHNVDELLAQATSEVRPLEVKDDEHAGPYLVKEGAICYKKPSRDGHTTVPLCNFTARITEERERDDGVERTLAFVLDGNLATGQRLPTAEVTAPQFAGMGWTVSEWGSRAVVYAGQGTKDHLRAALQMLSGDVPHHTTYTHVGWREVGGDYYFLHAAGVIAPPTLPVLQTIQVEPPQGLEAFALSQPPVGEDLRQALLASLATLDLAPDSITVPLLGMVYRAVFSNVDFGGHLAGQTGAGKSELAAVMQQHFGAGLDARHLPGSWSSTANALEGLAFAGKDVLVVVDDFAPEGSSYDIQRYHATAARLFRAQGNTAARGRMYANGSLRPNKPPRGLILSTGEDIPKGHSIKARTLILELEPGTLNWPSLTKAQKLASEGVYAAAMAGFISWFASDYQARIAVFKADHKAYRQQLQNTGHRRTVDAGAQLLAAYKNVLAFALEIGALTEPEHAALWQRIEAGIQAALEPQAALQAQNDPVARFSELLTGLLVSRRAHVADADTGGYPGEGWGWESVTVLTHYGHELEHRAKGARIGWVDGPDLYLEPNATYAELQRFAKDQGDSMPVTERTLWKRLYERGMILDREGSHMTVKRSFTGTSRVRVLKLSSTLYQTGASGTTGENVAQDSEKERPNLDNDKTRVGQTRPTHQIQDERPTSPLQADGAEAKSGTTKSTSQTGQTPHAPVAPLLKGVSARLQKVQRAESPDVRELRRRFENREFTGCSMKLPVGKTDDLDKVLAGYFRKEKLTDTEAHDLEEIARASNGRSVFYGNERMTRKTKQSRLLSNRMLEPIKADDLVTRYRCRCGNTAETGIKLEAVICTRCALQ